VKRILPMHEKDNDIKGLEDSTSVTVQGPLDRAEEFVDTFAAGFVYATAIKELVRQTLEIELALATLDEEEKALLPTLREDIIEINMRWVLATEMFAIEA
jgi:methyl coenzyme M reductase beta subunit